MYGLVFYSSSETGTQVGGYCLKGSCLCEKGLYCVLFDVYDRLMTISSNLLIVMPPAAT